MIPINEKKHVKRLNDFDIVIEDRFYDKKNKTQQIVVRASNYEKNDPVIECPRLEKEYFYKGQSIYRETHFDSEIKYSYISNMTVDKIIECPCCGYESKAADFAGGCPYCDTDFCINISKKREKIKDIVINDSTAIFVVLIIGTILLKLNLITHDMFFTMVSIIELGIFIYLIYEILKVSSSSDLWHEFKILSMNINEQRVYNDLNSQLKDFYFDENNEKEKNLIDFDILKYVYAVPDKGKDILLTYKVRKYYFEESSIKVVENFSKVRLTRNTKVKVKKSISTKCKNCGSPIDFNAKKCPYCDTKNESNIGWIISEIIDDELNDKIQ